MKFNIFIFALLSLIVVGCQSSSDRQNNTKVSFHGITLGEEIPDSIMQYFEDNSLGFYSDSFQDSDGNYILSVNPLKGIFPLSLGTGSVNLETLVYRHPETNKVYRILITDLYYGEAESLYSMYAEKYGKPASCISDVESPTYKDLTEAVGNMINCVLVQWTPSQDKNIKFTWKRFGLLEQKYFITEIEYLDDKCKESVYEYAYKLRTKSTQEAEIEKEQNTEALRRSGVLNQDF